jgi:hypothetical protein
VGKGFGGEPSAQPAASSNRGLGQLQQLQKQMLFLHTYSTIFEGACYGACYF